ncbi:MAG: TonB-dependent receptor [Chitinispirillaceae bacterium]|nr:TonB-dependent receptor [Chitinispirillaceae bacterium]
MNHYRKWQGVTVVGTILLLSSAGPLPGETDLSDEGTDMSLEDLVNVTITVASKSEESIADAPGVISVINQDELRRFGGTTLGDILKRVPSFMGTTVYMTDRSVIASRGDQIMASSSHVLLLINGRPMREVLEGGIKSEVYESFPVSVIERIEVIRGPGSVLYGSQAFSAVINVVTKSPENSAISVSGSLGEGLHNNVMADFQYRIGDFGIVLAGRYADKGGWEMDWEAPGLLPDSVHHIDISIPDYGPGAYGELSFKDFRLMCAYYQWTNQQYIPDFEFLHDLPDTVPGSIKGHTTGSAIWKKLFGDLGYSHTFADWYTTSMNFTYTRSLFETIEWPTTFRDAFEIIGEWTNFFTPIENFNITFGGVWGFMTGTERNAKIKTVIFNEGHKQNNFSGYGQIDYRWGWCKVIGGIQANKVRVKDSTGNVDNFKADFNPRGGLILYPFEHVNIKALYSTAYRAPSINELYLDHPEMKGKTMGVISDMWTGDKTNNGTLKPEKVHTFDVGANYQDDKVQFGVNGFHSRMKNLIFQERTGRWVKPTYENISEVSIFGLECEGKYYLTREFLFEGSMLYQQSNDENTGEDNVTPLPNFSAKGGLSYQADFGFTISAFNTFRQALDPKYDSELNTTTKHFNMTNLHCSYDLNKLFKWRAAQELSLVLNIDNLLDEEVWLPAWGLERGSTIPYNQGRTIYGGFKVAF